MRQDLLPRSHWRKQIVEWVVDEHNQAISLQDDHFERKLNSKTLISPYEKSRIRNENTKNQPCNFTVALVNEESSIKQIDPS